MGVMQREGRAVPGAKQFASRCLRPRAPMTLPWAGPMYPAALARAGERQRVVLSVLLPGDPNEVLPGPPGVESTGDELPIPVPVVPVPDMPVSTLVVPVPAPVVPGTGGLPVPVPLTYFPPSVVAEPVAPVLASGDGDWGDAVVAAGSGLRSQAESASVAPKSEARASILQPASGVFFTTFIGFS